MWPLVSILSEPRSERDAGAKEPMGSRAAWAGTARRGTAGAAEAALMRWQPAPGPGAQVRQGPGSQEGPWGPWRGDASRHPALPRAMPTEGLPGSRGLGSEGHPLCVGWGGQHDAGKGK